MKTFKLGGIHPAPSKITAGMPIEQLPLPRRAVLPLAQHIGAPAAPCVSVGDHVGRGQLIATAAGAVSAPLHASISGTVKAIGEVDGPAGYPMAAIIIEASEADHEADTVARDRRLAAEPQVVAADRTPDGIRDRVASAGIVGMGGATFPTVVKMGGKTPPEVLIINACECEPYLTCDDALCREYAPQIIAGVGLMLTACRGRRAVIALEDNKPEAAAALRAALGAESRIEVVQLKTKYPQGGEKQLVEAVTGRRIPSGCLPADVGAAVQNVATAYAVYAAVECGMPLIERVVTVTGSVAGRGNFLVALGTPLAELLRGLPDDCEVVLGGPMMGRAAINLDAPVTKGTSGVLVMPPAPAPEVEPCVRCGSCVDACPMGLEPYLLSTYGRMRMWDEAAAARVADCIECGCCSYSCISSRPLLDYIRVAKSALRRRK